MLDEFINIVQHRLKEASLIKKYFRSPEIGNTCGLLSQDELKYIIALSEVIYDTSTMLERKRLHTTVQNWTKDRTEKDGYLMVFQQGIKFIKYQTERSGFNELFYDLSIVERTEILDKPEYMRLDMYKSPGFHNPFTVSKFVLRRIFNHKQDRNHFFFETLREDLIKGIFNSELGWTLVGYNSWPGVSGEYLAYTKDPETN